MTLSDFRHHAFGHSYGVYMKDIGLLARAVFVIDQQGTVRYAQYVPEVTSEPDYQRALAAVQECLSVAP
jgi:thiol peroxidase